MIIACVTMATIDATILTFAKNTICVNETKLSGAVNNLFEQAVQGMNQC